MINFGRISQRYQRIESVFSTNTIVPQFLLLLFLHWILGLPLKPCAVFTLAV